MAVLFKTLSLLYNKHIDNTLKPQTMMVGEFIVSELFKYITRPLTTPTDTDKTEALRLWDSLLEAGLFLKIKQLLNN